MFMIFMIYADFLFLKPANASSLVPGDSRIFGIEKGLGKHTFIKIVGWLYGCMAKWLYC